MERTDWLDGGLDSAAARFLMMTAITHHEFSSPTWGEHEVRKLHAELAELDRLAAQAVVDHAGSGPQRRRVNVRLTTLTKPRESAVEVSGLAPRSVRTKRAFDLPNGPWCFGRAGVHARLGEPASHGPGGLSRWPGSSDGSVHGMASTITHGAGGGLHGRPPDRLVASKQSGTAASRHHLGPVVNPLRWEA
jgi:hypothetical protein